MLGAPRACLHATRVAQASPHTSAGLSAAHLATGGRQPRQRHALPQRRELGPALLLKQRVVLQGAAGGEAHQRDGPAKVLHGREAGAAGLSQVCPPAPGTAGAGAQGSTQQANNPGPPACMLSTSPPLSSRLVPFTKSRRYRPLDTKRMMLPRSTEGGSAPAGAAAPARPQHSRGGSAQKPKLVQKTGHAICLPAMHRSSGPGAQTQPAKNACLPAARRLSTFPAHPAAPPPPRSAWTPEDV